MRLGKQKTFMDHAAEFAETALESIESALETAKESAIEAGTNAKVTAGPMLQDAKDRAVPLIAAQINVNAPRQQIVIGPEALAALLAAQRTPEGRQALSNAVVDVVGGDPTPPPLPRADA